MCAIHASPHGEVCRADGGDHLLDRRRAVAVRRRRSLFQKDPRCVEREEEKGEAAQDEIDEDEAAEHQPQLLGIIEEDELRTVAHSLEQCGEEKEKEQGQSERDEGDEHEREGKSAAAADVVQPPHGGGNGGEGQEDGSGGKDERDPHTEENPERDRRLAKEQRRREIDEGQQQGDGGKVQKGGTAAQCCNRQRIVTPCEPAVQGENRFIHAGTPSGLLAAIRRWGNIRRRIRVGCTRVGILVHFL